MCLRGSMARRHAGAASVASATPSGSSSWPRARTWAASNAGWRAVSAAAPRPGSIAAASLTPCCGWRRTHAGAPCSRSIRAAMSQRASPRCGNVSSLCRKARAISERACSASSGACRPVPPSSSAATSLPSVPSTLPRRSDCSPAPMPCWDRRKMAATGWWDLRGRGCPAPFAGVRWSGPHALADTLANLKDKRVAVAAPLSDVDTEEDFRLGRACVERLILGPGNWLHEGVVDLLKSLPLMREEPHGSAQRRRPIHRYG